MKLTIIPACLVCGKPRRLYRCVNCGADYCAEHQATTFLKLGYFGNIRFTLCKTCDAKIPR